MADWFLLKKTTLFYCFWLWDVVTWDFKDRLSYFIYVMCTFLDLAGILDVIQPLVGRGKMFPNWLASSCVSLGEIGFTNFFLSFFCSEIGTLAYSLVYLSVFANSKPRSSRTWEGKLETANACLQSKSSVFCKMLATLLRHSLYFEGEPSSCSVCVSFTTAWRVAGQCFLDSQSFPFKVQL